MREIRTHGILLRQTALANDDVILDFFTSDFGRVSLFCKGLAKSQKKKKELDFFRLLEIGIFQGRSSKSLKYVSTKNIFSGISGDFSVMEVGFLYLQKIQEFFLEEKPMPDFFRNVVHIFSETKREYLPHTKAYFLVQLLKFSGIFPIFSRIRSDVYWNVATSELSLQKSPEMVFLENIDRQILEFLRRSTVEEFLDRRKNLPEERLGNLIKILEKINH